MQSYIKKETIAAIATPPGEGGIAIIRISGKRARDVAARIFSGPVLSYPTHTVHFGKILDANGRVIDEGLFIVMQAPHSFTGEDVVEIHCHGGVLLSQQVLQAALAAGAKMALPGEFSFRAFQNGKIDLTKAEAIQAVIASKSELAHQAAYQQLEGKLYDKVSFFQRRLTEIAAILEAWVDFPEEGLEFTTKEEMAKELETLVHEMRQLHATFHEGILLQTGLSISIIGAPNVGKSCLFNILTGKESAIVTPIPGTTRDPIDKEVTLAGLHVRLIDTAGIRKGKGTIEREGIARSLKMLQKADLVLLILDVKHPQAHPDFSLFPTTKTLAVWNKIDLPFGSLPPLPFLYQVKISAKMGTGMDQLKKMIEAVIWKEGYPSKEELILTNRRHFEALGNTITYIKKAICGLKRGLSPEFTSLDMRAALEELGMIIGTNITEELLSVIFSKFCVGK